MILQQHIEFDAPYNAPGNTILPVFLRIPMTATLWTTIEGRSGEQARSSPIFPSRILEPDRALTALFSGVDLSGLLRGVDKPEGVWEYRMHWIIQADPHDASPKYFVVVPLGKLVSFSFAHGGSQFVSVSIAGVDVQLEFNKESRLLSTSWFSIPFTSSWSLEVPRRMITAVMEKIWNSPLALLPLLSSSEKEERPQEASDRIDANQTPPSHLPRLSLFKLLTGCCIQDSGIVEPTLHAHFEEGRI